MSIIRSGALRHRVTLQAPVITQDEFGGPITTWTTVATLWALVESLGGNELVVARQVFAQGDYKVMIKYYAGITNKHRFQFGGMNLDIINPSDFEMRHIMIECICVNRVDQP